MGKITPEKMQLKRERAKRFRELMDQITKKRPDISRYRIAEDTGIRWNTLWYLLKEDHFPSPIILAKIEKYAAEVLRGKAKKPIVKAARS